MGSPNSPANTERLRLIAVPGPLTYGVAREGSTLPIAIFGLHSDAVAWCRERNAELAAAPPCTWCKRPLLDDERDDRFEDMHFEPCAGEYAQYRAQQAVDDAVDRAMDAAADSMLRRATLRECAS